MSARFLTCLSSAGLLLAATLAAPAAEPSCLPQVISPISPVDLRQPADVEIVLETRMVSLSEEGYQTLALLYGADMKQASFGFPSVTYLDDEAMAAFLTLAQSDRDCNVMQAPKMTTFDGQKVVVKATDRQTYVTGVDTVPANEPIFVPRQEVFETGLKMGLCATLGPSRQIVGLKRGCCTNYVNLDVNINLTSLDSEQVPLYPVVVPVRAVLGGGAAAPPVMFTQFIQQPRFTTLEIEKAVQVADGKTVLLNLGHRSREVCRESDTPLLGKLTARVPYVNRLFKDTAYERRTEHVLCLITPRIMVVPEEAPPQYLPPSPPFPLQRELEAQERAAAVTQAVYEAPAFTPVEESKARFVNSRSVKLQYTIEDVNLLAVSNVEVWQTRDRQTWERVASDAPASGPYTVQVPGDGKYGFTLIPRSRNGLGRPGPARGEQPQMWVEVDATKPEVALTGVEVRREGEEGKLTVRWRATDRHLKERPISITYAISVGGPWRALPGAESLLPNTGQHVASAGGLSRDFMIRVEAEDEAGNVGSATSPWIHFDPKAPRKHNLHVEGEEKGTGLPIFVSPGP